MNRPFFAFKNVVTKHLKEKNIRVIPHEAPLGEPESAGSIESTVKQAHNNFPWAIMYGAQVTSRSHKHDDCTTGWQK
eukprot:3932568-Karenia_brevis.AAC.1